MRKEVIGRIYPTGPEHPGWLVDGVSEAGGRTRALRLYPTIGPCEGCGSKRSERHHKDGNTANNDIDNIAALCRKCHMASDGRLLKLSALGSENQRSGVAVRAAAEKKKAQTHCKRGHPLSGANLFTTSAGARGCKECRKIHKRAYHEKTGRW